MALRDELCNLVTWARSRSLAQLDPVWECNLAAPCVVHQGDAFNRFRPDAVFVGCPQGARDLSPWTAPFLQDDPRNELYLRERADLMAVLRPLSMKVLVCTCSTEDASGCWGKILKTVFCETFGVPFDDDYAPMDLQDYADESDESDDYPEDRQEDGEEGQTVLTERQRDLNAAGAQASRKRPGQLIKDGLEPFEHLQQALEFQHPFLAEQASTNAMRLAGVDTEMCADEVKEWRCVVVECLWKLHAECQRENEELFEMASAPVRAVLRAYCEKQVCFMQELAFIVGPSDYAAIPSLMTGLPMVGWAPPADGLMERIKQPETSVDVWLQAREATNAKVLSRVGPSGDDALDKQSFDKSIAERDAGVLIGPFMSIDEMPCKLPCLVPRQGIWECHGVAEKPSVRHIDDMRYVGQNATSGTVHSHRPTDADALVSQIRFVAVRRPGRKLSGWASDFVKAF